VLLFILDGYTAEHETKTRVNAFSSLFQLNVQINKTVVILYKGKPLTLGPASPSGPCKPCGPSWPWNNTQQRFQISFLRYREPYVAITGPQSIWSKRPLIKRIKLHNITVSNGWKNNKGKKNDKNLYIYIYIRQKQNDKTYRITLSSNRSHATNRSWSTLHITVIAHY
jgi:hypothetical protein